MSEKAAEKAEGKEKEIIEAEAAKVAKLIESNRFITLSPEQFNQWQSNSQKAIEALVEKQNSHFTKLLESFKAKETAMPSSPAGGTGGISDTVRRVAEFFNSGSGDSKWSLSKEAYLEQWRNAYRKAVRTIEAVTSTNVPGIVFDRDVLLLPDGQSMVNIRPFVNFEKVPDGADTFHWHKLGKVTFAATPDSTTISPSSQTATRIAGTVARRGALQAIGYNQSKSLPFNLVDAVSATMAAGAIHDEAAHTLEQPATEASPDNWIRGDTGATITDDDVASTPLKFDGMNKAVELLTTEGYAKESLVAFVHPKPYAELISDAIETLGLDPFGSALLTSGQIERYLGVRIVPTPAVYLKDNTTVDAYRSIVCVSGVALGLAARDELELEADRDIKEAEINIGGGHYIKAAVIDKGAYVRVSTAK